VFYSAPLPLKVKAINRAANTVACSCSYVRTRISSRETERLWWWWWRSPEGLGVGVVSAQPRVDAVGVEVVHALGEHAHRLAVGEVGQAHGTRRLAPGPRFLSVRAHHRRSLDQVHPRRRRAHVHAVARFFLLVRLSAAPPAVVAGGDEDAVARQEHHREAHDAQQSDEHRRLVRRRAHRSRSPHHTRSPTLASSIGCCCSRLFG
jgi:hypothetical protein